MTEKRRKLLGEDVKMNSQEMERQAVVMPAMTSKQPFHCVIATLARSGNITSMDASKGHAVWKCYGDVHGKKVAVKDGVGAACGWRWEG